MNDELKQRLVGASVLALLGALLIPWLLGNPKDPRGSIQASFEGSPMPLKRPEATPMRVPVPSSSPVVALRAPVPVASSRPVPASQSTPRPVATPKPTPASKPGTLPRPVPTQAPSRWIVQLASYHQTAPADDFIQRLRKKGYQAYREPFNHRGKTFYRVRIRANGSKQDALKLQKTLEQKFGIQAQLFESR